MSKYSFLSNLFLLFLGLKLAQFIDWSWWAIFMPFILKAFLAILDASLDSSKYSKKDKEKSEA